MKKAAAQIEISDKAVMVATAQQQIEWVLKAKAEGRLTYKPLDEIAAKYGFNAR